MLTRLSRSVYGFGNMILMNLAAFLLYVFFYINIVILSQVSLLNVVDQKRAV